MSTIAQQFIFRCFKHLQGGQVIFTLPDHSTHQFGTLDPSANLHPIHIQIFDLEAFNLITSRGDIGVAEGYFKGLWHTDDLEQMLQLAIQNRNLLDDLIYGSWLGSFYYKIRHFFNRNSRTGSKKNIQAHYDLGNQFYQLWLDPSMMYSSALFHGNKNKSLQEAQQDKCLRILDSLEARPGEKLLEIGCGWGGFMREASARNIHIDAITISNEQFRFVQNQLSTSQEQQSTGQRAVILQDYRDCNLEYDGIVSIEMFEAVGESYWPSYFKTIYRCLKPGKKAIIQSIVIDEGLFPKYRTQTDFIQQYIFPGGMLPSVSIFENQAKSAGLRVKDKFFFGEDYAQTLRLWAQAFNQRLEEVKELGFKDEFIRLWNFYLYYCAAGFSVKNLEVVQFTLEKPLHES